MPTGKRVVFDAGTKLHDGTNDWSLMFEHFVVHIHKIQGFKDSRQFDGYCKDHNIGTAELEFLCAELLELLKDVLCLQKFEHTHVLKSGGGKQRQFPRAEYKVLMRSLKLLNGALCKSASSVSVRILTLLDETKGNKTKLEDQEIEMEELREKMAAMIEDARKVASDEELQRMESQIACFDDGSPLADDFVWW